MRTILSARAATLAGLGAAAALASCDQMKAGVHDAIRDEAAASIDKVPADTIIGELRADFPQDYAQLRAQAAEQAASGGGLAGVRATSARFMRTFFTSHEAAAEQAPPPALVKVAAGAMEVLMAAQVIGDDVCTDLWAHGRVPSSDRSTPRLQAALQHVGVAQVAAVRAGLDHPAGRSAGPFTPTEGAAMVAAAGRSGVSRDTIVHDASLSAQVRCRTGIAVYRGIQTLPPEQAARVEGRLLHGAFKPG